MPRRAAEVVVPPRSRPSRNGPAVPAASTPAPAAEAPRREPLRCIRIRGAKEHNLKSLNADIPRDQLVVITGLSGSGKSSLAFDTIFAEGQRKYMESLSAYARQFLDQLKKPDVEEIDGIPPTIAIEQRGSSANPRSTVATTTEIYDYLRLLFARCGRARSWFPTKVRKDGTVLARSGAPISATTSTQIVDAILGGTGLQTGASASSRAALQSGAATGRIMILAPVIRGQKGFHRDKIEELSAQGWGRARVNGTVIELREALKDPGENPLKLGRYEKHDIDAVIDRLALSSEPELRQRLAESIEAALKIADGTVIVSFETGNSWTDQAYSTNFSDPDHPEIALEELSPRLFSFNSPHGACPTCHGLGTLLEFDEALVVPNEQLPLSAGAIAAWNKNGPVRAWYNRFIKKFCKLTGADYNGPFAALNAEQRRILLHGTTRDDALRLKAKFEGVIPNITQWWGSTQNPDIKEWLGQFMSQKPCTTCNGDRLRIEALHVLIESTHAADTSQAFSASIIGRPVGRPGTVLNIAELSRLNILDAREFLSGLKLSTETAKIAEPILKEINNRLRFLCGVGLEYLSLDRRTATLSGGEAQRIRLATQVGSGLVGACYVLDEPTIGLHQRDNDRLISTLRHLTDIGNTVLVVEHDEDMIRSADHVLDIGPGPGVHGGRIVAQGTVADIIAEPASITGQYLSGRRTIPLPKNRRALSEKRAIIIKGAKQNNLKTIDAVFPLGGIICVTGVSGSGKSTLVNDILLAAARNTINGSREKPGAHTSIKFHKDLDRVIEVDQSAIGRTPRSNAATYTGIFDDIRNVFAQTKESKIRGYQPGRFSFNVPAKRGGGRCEACEGQGLKKIEMHFLPDVFVECEVCRGRRYNRETLEILYKGKSIADVLSMTVENACTFFENHPKILRFLQCLHDVGLDYIELGQPSTTLSGGEAQRVKLATELGKGAGQTGTQGHTLYILDEPTTGLHFEDIRKLVEVFNRLADAGNTLVVIEHNLDVIKCADWLIDLGPEGGDGGGRIVASGTPEAVMSAAASYTGRYLKKHVEAEARRATDRRL
ncbi:MAG: excinuclease ABC subunit UvrA [Phycisphaeraceae bacterium]|nr:excinuclease ABC subunit UvrA [Phycisphaeraceae bacterium]